MNLINNLEKQAEYYKKKWLETLRVLESYGSNANKNRVKRRKWGKG
jgi:hypothetical protein